MADQRRYNEGRDSVKKTRTIKGAESKIEPWSTCSWWFGYGRGGADPSSGAGGYAGFGGFEESSGYPRGQYGNFMSERDREYSSRPSGYSGGRYGCEVPGGFQGRPEARHVPESRHGDRDRYNRSGAEGYTHPPSISAAVPDGYENFDARLMQKDSLSPKRPGHGEKGRRIKLWTNYFDMAFKDWSKTFLHYDVNIQPECPPIRNRMVFQELIKLPQSSMRFAVYDGRKNIYSAVRLPESTFSFTVTLQLAQTSPQIQLQDIYTHVFEGGIENPREVLSVLDILLKSVPAEVFHPVSRATGVSFYPQGPEAYRAISNGLGAVQGWKQTIKPTYKAVLLNLDIATTCFYPAGPLIDAIAAFAKVRSIRDVNQQFFIRGSRDFMRLSKYLKNVNVLAQHREKGRRKYKIQGLSPQSADKTIVMIDVETPEARPMSVSQYFLERLGKRLAYPQLPVVNVGMLKVGKEPQPIYIPMEFLHIKKGQRHLGKLDDSQTADIIKIAALRPKDRMAHIEAGRRTLHTSEDAQKLYSHWGISIGSKMREVDARILSMPRLLVEDGRGRGNATIIPDNGAFNLSRGSKFYQPSVLRSYAIALIGRDAARLSFRSVETFMGTVLDQCRTMGIQVENLRLSDITVSNASSTIAETLQTARDAAVQAARKAGHPTMATAQMVFCIIDRKGAAEYDQIKQIAETRLNLMTQCIITKHFHNSRGGGVALNLALKINAKLGGINVALDPPQKMRVYSGTETMVLGVDITHPGAGALAEGARSVAAVVGSIDTNLCKYRSECGHLPPRQEIIKGLGELARPIFEQYRQNHPAKSLPTTLIVYRDGVSEGQFNEVALNEIQSLKECLQSYGPEGAAVKLTFMIINKRHATRFFVKERQDGDKNGNVMAGTVVDTGIVHPFEYDFFLNSHQGLQGTSRAAHYHVIYDESKFLPDDLQEFTYNMCYMFARATRSVSIVPAVYYAHLMASRIKCYRVGGGGSDTASMISGGAGVDYGTVEQFAEVADGMKKTMFFT
ncbi:Piwi domain-containing protein [Chytridium lagenaria]|nr:Piwi domain-containing protein [Chytridium lagenaria]